MMTEEAPLWEHNEGGELNLQKRHFSHGTVTVMAKTDGRGWAWWVDVPSTKARAEGVELGQGRAKHRAMLVYLALTREGMTT